MITEWTGDGRGTRSRGPWKFEPLPMVPQDGSTEVHVIENVSFFAHCRRDRFCRCRKCKPRRV
jgi:hypothetical protein